MPIVDYAKYCKMLDKAQNENYAYPGINITSTDTLNAAIEGFAEAKSDGIIQVSTGGGAHASGNLKDEVMGAISLAEHAHRVAAGYDINIALHTDHCQPGKVDSFLKPPHAGRQHPAAGREYGPVRRTAEALPGE